MKLKKNHVILAVIYCLFDTTVCAQHIPVYLDENFPLESRVENALSKMTLEEKVAVIHAQAMFSSAGVPRLGIPELWMTDGPHGIRAELNWNNFDYAKWANDECTAFPALTCLAATFNPELAYQYGKAIGEEALYRKKNVVLGPGVNIYRMPLNGRNFEYMGEDPFLTSKMAVPYIQGVQQNGVAACVKHYALNNQEQWRQHINVELSDRALHEIYLPAFKASVLDGKVWCVMGSYNKIRGQYGCHNNLLINEILKKNWSFDGVVISDWGGVHDANEAVFNGLDIEMGTWTDGLKSNGKSTFDNYYMAATLLDKIKKGEIPESAIDNKVRRTLRLIFRTSMNSQRKFGSLVSDEHINIARKIGEEGIVLLKNDKNFFPVEKGKYKKILVIGENATKPLTLGGGSSELKVKEEISPLDGLKRKYGEENIDYTMGYGSGPSEYAKEVASPYNADSLHRKALEMSKDAEIILFIGGLNKNHHQDCEAGDRLSYNLPFEQNKLISDIFRINKNVGIVLISGNAVAMPWIKEVPAVMQAWYLGSESGTALTNIISGDTNPSGKLPFSFPINLKDNGALSFGESSYPGDNVNQHYKEDILVGYRWHDTKKIKPLFAFGYGLSYTKFEYGKIEIVKKDFSKDESVELKIPISNIGERDGAETVQFYVTQSQPSVLRPEKELKAFKKIFLKVGETKHIDVVIPVSSFAFYNEQKQSWIVEEDKYIIHCASSANDIKNSVSIFVK